MKIVIIIFYGDINIETVAINAPKLEVANTYW